MEQQNHGRNLSGKFEAEFSSGFHRGANKLVKRNIIPKEIIEEAIANICYQPRLGSILSGKYKNSRRHRFGDFRIIYSVNWKTKVCYFRHIRKREKAYK